MSLYKPDILEAQQRMTAWWEGKKVDRALAYVTAPVVPSHPRVSAYRPDVPGKYTDPNTTFSNLDYRLERTFHGGEAFPEDVVYLGPMFHLAFLGCEPHFTENTTWYEPCFESVDDMLGGLQFDPQNRWWLLVQDLIRQSIQRSHGNYLTNMGPYVLALMDTLAGLLGTEKLLVALTEEPDKIIALRDRLAGWTKQTYQDTVATLQASPQKGTIDWMSVWSPRKVMTSQCDMCVMISPQMFREFVVPDLESSYAQADDAIYHLDGEEEIQHLDSLLSIAKLRMIQWIPSLRAAQPDYRNPLNWISLFKRIQAAGKSVLIYCPPGQVGELLQQIDRDKVMLFIDCPDVTTAQQTLLELERIGV